MSEPACRAEALVEVVPGLFHWMVLDDRIDFRSEAYAVRTREGHVLIDPLPIEPDLLERLSPIRAICITGGFHQRSAWRLRRESGVEVFAPAGSRSLDESPDHWLDDGGQPVPGLIALRCHGPTNPHFVFRFVTSAGRSVLFCADLLMRADEGPFAFVPDDHQEAPARTREAARGLLDLSIDVLCPAHGPPLVGGVTEAIRAALAEPEPPRRFA